MAIKNNDKKSFRSLTYCTYSREISRSLWGWICSKKATPFEASGGEMNGCTDGRWVMGTPYTVSSKVDLPPTTVFGIYKASVYDDITPAKVAINETVPTAADVRLPSLAFCRQHTTL